MKILNLHLMAFGPFTDLDLDLTRDRSGMQIVYGPNEAGKSSALRALTGWLFGIEHNSPDNFIHDYKQLKIGGTLTNSAGRELTFIRRKGRSNTVLTTGGEPLDDDILRDYLQGIDRQLFLSMFGIDHQALVNGGEDILKGGGELGQSLFAAGLGIADLRGVIKELEEKERALFLPRGQLQIINQAISEYAVHKKIVSDQSLRSRDWIEKDQAVRDYRLQQDKISGDLGKVSAERHRLERLNQVIPRIAKRDALVLRQENLGGVVSPQSRVHRGQEGVSAPAGLRPGQGRQRLPAKPRSWKKNSMALGYRKCCSTRPRPSRRYTSGWGPTKMAV